MTNRLFGDDRIRYLAFALIVAGCGGGSSQDAGLAAVPDAGACGIASTNACADTSAYCTCKPALASVTDLSGTWVLETIGAQLVKAPSFTQPFNLRSVNVILVQVVQTGSTVVLNGEYCDRSQHDDPCNPAKVVVLDAWRLTSSPLQRNGTLAADNSGQLALRLPSLTEVFGARLADPVGDPLPADPNDPRLLDVDNDGYPGLSVGLKGLVNGTIRSVQRQTTALAGVAVTADRVEGGMAYASDQAVIASEPPEIKTLYASSTSYSDPTPCSSSFVMVKVPDSTATGPVDCAWVRANEAVLFGP